MAVVVKLMIGVAPLMAKSYDSMLPKSHILRTPISSCFEIYGFDVMIDQDLKVRLAIRKEIPNSCGAHRGFEKVSGGGSSHRGRARSGFFPTVVYCESTRPVLPPGGVQGWRAVSPQTHSQVAPSVGRHQLAP